MKLAPIFTDKMVLQRKLPIRVFGTGDGSVTVSFNGETVSGKSESGQWLITLSPLEAGGPYEMDIDLNGEKIILSDILIGDVFLAAGQSNMEMPLFKTESGFDDSLNCKNENIRYFTVPRRYKKGVDNYGYHFEGILQCDRPWEVCDIDSALHFSAIGHYFAEYIEKELNVPVGIISCNWGGKRVESFLKKSYFYDGTDSMKKQIEVYDNYLQSLDMEEYERTFETFVKKREDYMKEVHSDVFGDTKIVGVYAAAAKAHLNGCPISPKGPYDGVSPSTLWDSMYSEIVPFPFKAMLWYQGESNVGDTDYTEKYLTFLRCIREEFMCDIDAYTVEIAPYLPDYNNLVKFPMDYFLTNQSWPHLREQQQKAVTVGERNYMITTQGLGDIYEIHPKRKKELAHRLAKKVLKHTYKMDIDADQPIYKNAEFTDGKACITLDNADGLFAKWENVNMYIAGSDHILHKAKVELLPDNRLLVYSDEVKEPILVRYGFCMHYFGEHIYNSAGLPLAPFRTDNV